MRSMGRAAPPRARSKNLAGAQGLLEQQRWWRVNEISELSVQVRDARTAVALAGSESLGVELQLFEERLAAVRRGLVETEEALERLADGSYGLCERCVQPIAPERLEVLPDARLCTPCQSLRRTRR